MGRNKGLDQLARLVFCASCGGETLWWWWCLQQFFLVVWNDNKHDSPVKTEGPVVCILPSLWYYTFHAGRSNLMSWAGENILRDALPFKDRASPIEEFAKG